MELAFFDGQTLHKSTIVARVESMDPRGDRKGREGGRLSVLFGC